MSSAAISFISSPNSLCLSHGCPVNRNAIFLFSTAISRCSRVPPLKPPSPSSFFIRIPNGSFKKASFFTSSRPFSPVMEWQDCTVKMEVDVPASVAYKCYSDREAIPNWMPFISSVKVLEDKPELSRWSLKYKAFGRNIEYSWLARNMQPIPNQKIHWRSLEGLPNRQTEKNPFPPAVLQAFSETQLIKATEKGRMNLLERGAIRFYPKGPSSCLIELTISYEVPQLLTPVASALQPFLENLLKRGLDRFARFAKSSGSTR